MARPTNDKKENTIILRINAETKAYLEEKATEKEQNVSEYLREMINREKSGGNNNVIQNKSHDLAELEGMTGFFDMSVEDFLHQVCERLNEGYVSIEGGKVVTYDSSGINLERFKEVCHEKNIDVQKGMEKCVQMLMRG